MNPGWEKVCGLNRFLAKEEVGVGYRKSVCVFVFVCVNEKESGWKDKRILWPIAHNN